MSDPVRTPVTCYRHPDRRAGVSCQRCDRPICPNCMVQASVGFHCPECARGGRQKVYTARNLGTLNRPIVTMVLVAVNVLAYFVTSGGASIYGDSTSNTALDYVLYGPFIADNGEFYRLVTGGFLHANLIHLITNMVALWFLGNLLEPALGKLRFTTVYFVSLLGGSLGVMIMSFDQPTVGASGAIFGLLGCAAAGQWARGTNLWQSGIGTLIIINLLITFTLSDVISVGGHVGGLIAGFLCGTILYRMQKVTPSKYIPVFLCAVLGVACFAASLAIAASQV